MGGGGRNRASSEITVFLIAGNRLLRDGMARLLKKDEGIRLVGASPSTGLAWQEVAASRSKVVLAECTTLRDSPELFHDLTANVPESLLVIFGIYEDLDLFLRLVSLKVSGYALSDASADKLIGLVREVAQGEMVPAQVLEPLDAESLGSHTAVHAIPGGNLFSES